MYKVGGLSFGNGAESVVAVGPEADIHGWQNAGRECLSVETQ